MRYLVCSLLLCCALLSAPKLVPAQAAPVKPVTESRQDPRARAILDQAKQKLKSIDSLVADYGSGGTTDAFVRERRISLERPNRFRIERIGGVVVEKRTLLAVSDGQTVTRIREGEFVAYSQPLRRENFFLGQNFLVQFFFDPRGIAFDPADETWGRAISLFDTNLTAYDKDTRLIYMGERTLKGRRYDVVEIKYDTPRADIRQQIHVGEDRLVYQVDTYFGGELFSQKFGNFRVNAALPPTTWSNDRPAKMPLVSTDPVRMGSPAPAFTLPGHAGGEFSLQQVLQGRKGLYVCTLDGTVSKQKADYHLPQMRVLQEIKDKFEKQGLGVIAIVGGVSLTPDLKEEMMLNWLPDVSRFNYPVLIDIDVEKGIQGSAFQNFRLNGRNNLLLDAKGRVVFAAQDFNDKVNQLAFYQALAQIGFSVSAADLDSAAR